MVKQKKPVQEAAPERRKGRFYLILAIWWSTIKGQKWLARKGIERRLRAFIAPQKCKGKTHRNARCAIANAHEHTRVLLEREEEERKMEMRPPPLGYP